MKTYRSLPLTLAVAVAGLTGCDLTYVDGSGHVVSELRPTPAFQAIEVSDGIAATVVVDDYQPQEVRVEGDDNLVALVKTEVIDGRTLRVYLDQAFGNWTSHNPLRVTARVANLESVDASGGAAVDVRGLDRDSFRVAGSGGGEVALAGSVTRIEADISGGTRVLARDLSTRNADLTSSGGGSVELRVSDTLRVVASGGSSLRIIGRPSVLDESLSGGSTIRFE